MRPSPIPNIITSSRIVLTVLLYPILIAGYNGLFIVLFVITALSDAVDGYLARRWKSTSALGRRLDSLADYLFIGSVPIWVLLKVPAPIAERYLVPFIIVALVTTVYLLVRLSKPATFFHLPSAKLANIVVVTASALLLAGYVFAWTIWIAVCIVLIAELEELAIIAGINARRRG